MTIPEAVSGPNSAPSMGAKVSLIVGGGVTIVLGLAWTAAYYLSQGTLPIPTGYDFNILVGALLLVGGIVLLVVGLRTPSVPVAAAAAGSTNSLAIAAFVLAFVSAIPGVICGHIALGQISRTGQSGRGLATAALVIGYATIVATFIFAVIAFVVLAR